MKYFYVTYGFSQDGNSGQGSFYSKRENGEIYPQELAEWARTKNNHDSVVILNWIEISKTVFDKSIEDLNNGKK